MADTRPSNPSSSRLGLRAGGKPAISCCSPARFAHMTAGREVGALDNGEPRFGHATARAWHATHEARIRSPSSGDRD